MAIEVALATRDQEGICGQVLGALPQWFAIESAREEYAQFAAGAPMLVAKAGAEIVGYVSLADHFGRNCELHSIGVKPEWHRRGIGRALIDATMTWAAERGFTYVTVKTLSERHPDRNYAATRKFYASMGFLPFEELPDLWGDDSPCVILIRKVAE